MGDIFLLFLTALCMTPITLLACVFHYQIIARLHTLSMTHWGSYNILIKTIGRHYQSKENDIYIYIYIETILILLFCRFYVQYLLWSYLCASKEACNTNCIVLAFSWPPKEMFKEISKKYIGKKEIYKRKHITKSRGMLNHQNHLLEPLVLYT